MASGSGAGVLAGREGSEQTTPPDQEKPLLARAQGAITDNSSSTK